MSLILFVLIAVLIAGVVAYAIRALVPDTVIANIGVAAVAIILILVIAQKAGIGL